MKIVPVLDLLKGVVVHGVKGERKCYQPVKSLLTDSTDPLKVARALHAETNCHAFYIADLDAIQETGNNRSVIKEISTRLNVALWGDAGTTDLKSVKQLLVAGADVVIIGSETLTSLQQLRTICGSITQKKIIFSLDISKGTVLSRAPSLAGVRPMEALKLLIQEGLDRFILLTLDAVGTAQGPDLPILREAVQNFPSVSFITGGGVKTPTHLHDLSTAGARHGLVATSLHKGWITGRTMPSSLK